MPSGAPPEASHGGNRSSSGAISILPSGNSPKPRNRIIDVETSLRPVCANLVGIKASPMSPAANMSLDGTAKKPRSLEATKNIEDVLLWPPAPLRITRLGFLIRRIEPGQLDALLDFGEHPALVEFVLGALVGDEIKQVLGDHHGAVVVGHDDVVGENRDAAAADRLVPADKRKAVDRRRRRDAGAPHRKAARKHAGLVAHCAVGDERRHAALVHAGAQDVAEDAGGLNPHGVRDRDHALRHRFDGGAGRDRLAPAFRRRQIFPRGDEAQSERRADQTRPAWHQRLRPMHPASPDALLEQYGGDGSSGDLAQDIECGSAHRKPHWAYQVSGIRKAPFRHHLIPQSQFGAPDQSTTRALSSASLRIASISAGSSSKSKIVMFSFKRSSLEVRGITTAPSWVRNRRLTWPAVLPWCVPISRSCASSPARPRAIGL